jgi:hypothetical protein
MGSPNTYFKRVPRLPPLFCFRRAHHQRPLRLNHSPRGSGGVLLLNQFLVDLVLALKLQGLRATFRLQESWFAPRMT